MQAPILNFPAIWPFAIICGWSLILMFVDVYLPEERRHWTGWLALVGLAAALLYSLGQWNEPINAFFTVENLPMITLDNFAVFLNITYLVTAILVVFMSSRFVKNADIERGEYTFLMLFSVAGMMLMGMANDLIIVFLALELLSIPLYILAGFDRNRLESEEAALKYFLLGAFSSGFLVFGIALIYGAVQSTAFPVIAERISGSGVLGLAGIALLLVGFAFKVGAVPFHMWTPDVYEGSPTSVTAFMSVGAKIGGFAALLRLFVSAFGDMSAEWVPAIAVIAALTMVVGNVAAVAQQNVKRMLAYSSIAHAGYILMAVAASPNSDSGVSSALYYMLTYLFTNLGAFAIVIAMERHEGKLGLMLDDYKGLAKRNLPLALVLTYFMMSLIGIPLTGGFTGKFYVFQSAVDAGLYWLVIIAALTSVVSAFYYLRLVYYAFMFDGAAEPKSLATPLMAALGFSLAITILLGIFPGPWYNIARDAAFNVVTTVAGG